MIRTPAQEKARRLTPPQKAAIFPGPGNPEYARGPSASMRKLERLGFVEQVNHFTTNGMRGGRLTESGKRLREELAKEMPLKITSQQQGTSEDGT